MAGASPAPSRSSPPASAPGTAESGPLPAGVTYANGVLSGTPVLGSNGVYPITFTASNGISSPVVQNFTLIVPGRRRDDRVVADRHRGAPYSVQLTGPAGPRPTSGRS